jgi:hypothetical protein
MFCRAGRQIVLLVLLLAAACGGQQTLTVAEAIQKADSLEGKTVHVRGVAYLWVDPSQAEMWMAGGCMPTTDPDYGQGTVKGWLTLYDSIDPNDLAQYGVPYEEAGVQIAETSFQCGGNYCKMTCSSFEAVSQRTYEFTGTLRRADGGQLILADVDLSQSRQLVDGKWTPISTGDFDVMFP